ncbi:MAG: hypothetical protein K1X56_06435, partial [Flavobacteriales bacterium]|nr:hypothetical protein [Flavobacteriales bacterium]
EEISEAKKKVQYALYHAGVIFKDELSQNDLAIKMFKDLLKKYDYGEFVLPANYQLYLIYSPGQESETYKSTILTDYPESEYARLIKNPNYKREGEEKFKQQEENYLSVYALYKQKRFDESLKACNEIIASEPDNKFISRYYFLRALNYGEMQQLEQLEQALSQCAEKFGNEETGKEAQSILDFLRNKKSKENPIDGFVYDANSEHFFIMVFTNSMGSIVEGKAAFSDFNTKYFSTKNYAVSNNFLNTDNQLLIIKSFPDKNAGMDYYRAVVNESERLKNYKAASYFLITPKNYAAFFLSKDIAKYMQFFQDNYLK